MNLAFSALVLFLLLLPGFILHYTYSRGVWRWNSPVSFQRYTDQITFAIVSAIVIHSISTLILSSLFNVTFDWTSILRLLLNTYGNDDQFYPETIQAIGGNLDRIMLYLISLYILAGSLGFAAHWTVRKLKLDRRYKFFRFENEWYYLLSGEALEFPESNVPEEDIPEKEDELNAFLATVVQHQDGSYLYLGIVQDFSYDTNGQLSHVILTSVLRRPLAKDRESDQPQQPVVLYESDPRYYPIAGDYLHISYPDMRTINIQYFLLRRKTAD